MAKPPQTRAQRVEVFWSFIDKSGGPDACWLWTRGHHENGYGRFWIDGRLEGAHRLAYIITCGDIPQETHVLHRCDNPPCCNPAHLFTGTNDDNINDMRAKKRNKNPPRHRGTKHPQAKLDEQKVTEMRARFSSGESKRSLAAAYGVTWQQVENVVMRRHWSHVA